MSGTPGHSSPGRAAPGPVVTGPVAPEDFLAAYDDSLRCASEVIDADHVDRIGPLWIGTFTGAGALVSYRDLEGADIPALVTAVLDLFSERPEIREIEWKTRSHDVAPGLEETLESHGFEAQTPESVMIGMADSLAVPVPIPRGVAVRRVTSREDLERLDDLHVEVFGGPHRLERLLREVAGEEPFECWIAEAGGTVVSTGLLRPVRGTRFAGIWGGGTHPRWRGQGIYRALTAHRSRSALRGGWDLIHSDSTEDSRPILERYGFVKVTGTTPYLLHR